MLVINLRNGIAHKQNFRNVAKNELKSEVVSEHGVRVHTVSYLIFTSNSLLTW